MSGTQWLQKQEHFDWMQKCLICWKVCEKFMAWSIESGECITSINTCRDVTEMCSQCIRFEAQRSPFFQQLCEVCADICERLVSEIRKSGNESGIVAETINSCIAFAETCRNVVEKPASEAGDLKSDFIPTQEDKT